MLKSTGSTPEPGSDAILRFLENVGERADGISHEDVSPLLRSAMSPESILDAAIRKTSLAERAAFLEGACAGDERLRREIESLLEAHQAPGVFMTDAAKLDFPVDGGQATVAYTSTDPTPGIVVAGRYTLEQKLGEGGMGEVWVARQSEPVKRKVALKLIKQGMDSKGVIARFEQERQALAVMDHANIAKVLDGGLTERGSPFFVMELVAGLPLNRFCDEARLAIADRLNLFVAICQAVQHAHQKGIVHRDLKPGNILITMIDGTPSPKIIDFGVAKAVSGKLTDESVSTHFGAMIGTMEYMAPEQAGFSMQDVDTRADIYSLGVILYELLTGLRPFSDVKLKKAAFDEVIRILREEEPPSLASRLSTDDSLPNLAALRRIEPRRLLSMVRGELDWIVHKCLDKDRNRRYESASGLGRDLQRYLAHEPVEARPVSVSYRIRKFARRHRGFVAAAAIVLLTLLLGMVGTTWGLLHAEERRVEAELAGQIAMQAQVEEKKHRLFAEEAKHRAEQAEAETLADYRASTDDAIEQLIGSRAQFGPQEKVYLERTLKRWQTFASRAGNDQRSRSIRAEGLFRVGVIRHKLGDLAGASTAYQQAMTTWSQLAQDYPSVSEYRRATASTYSNSALILENQGNDIESLAHHQRALSLLEQLVQEDPSHHQTRHQLARCYHHLAVRLDGEGKVADAEKRFQLALQLRIKLAQEVPNRADFLQDLGRNYRSLGLVCQRLKRPADALEHYEQAVSVRRKLATLCPEVPDYRDDLAGVYQSLGNLQNKLGKRDEARRNLEEVLEIYEALSAKFPAILEYQRKLGGAYCNMAILIRDGGDHKDSLAWYTKAIVILERLAVTSNHVAVKDFLSNSYVGRAGVRRYLGQDEEAECDWERGLAFSSARERPWLLVEKAKLLKTPTQLADTIREVGGRIHSLTGIADQWYDLACVYALASVKIPNMQREYSDRAVQVLRKAIQAGFNDASHISKDKDLESLRSREDYQTLLDQLSAKTTTK